MATATGVAAGTIAIAPILLQRRFGDAPSVVEHGVDAAGFLTIVAFIGALFGTRLLEADRFELLDSLRLATRLDASFTVGFLELVEHLDDSAQRLAGTDFSRASVANMVVIVDRIVRTDASSALLRLDSVASAEPRRRRHIRGWIVPKLAALYRRSGVPWRARGYHRWPGMAGEWREYLEADPPGDR